MYIQSFQSRKDVINQDINPYQLLIEDIGDSLHNENSIKLCAFFENGEDIMDPKELNPSDKNLMIFDDVFLENKNKN